MLTKQLSYFPSDNHECTMIARPVQNDYPVNRTPIGVLSVLVRTVVTFIAEFTPPKPDVLLLSSSRTANGCTSYLY